MVVVALALVLVFVAAGVGAKEVIVVLIACCFVIYCVKERKRKVSAFSGIENCR